MSVDSSETGKRIKNFVIVAVAAILSIAVILGVQTHSPAASLSEMAQQSMPLELAMANKKPTLIEFYANWCTSCQAMAPDIQALKESYRDRVNFVMLNVDNTKWLPEMLNYRVDGIPHFEFLSANSDEQGAAIGELPRAILADNLNGLIANQTLPYAQISGRVSAVDPVTNPIDAPTNTSDPRSHGAQVSTQMTN